MNEHLNKNESLVCFLTWFCEKKKDDTNTNILLNQDDSTWFNMPKIEQMDVNKTIFWNFMKDR